MLPIEDSGGILSAAAGDPNTSIVVVVCRDGNRHVGVAVSHVLDVASGEGLFEAGTGQQTGGVTLLKERVTGVVELRGVQPLPQIEQPPEEIIESAEAMA